MLVPGIAAARAATATFPAETAIPAKLTLLPVDGVVGRENPFYDGYRPSFIFAGGKADVMCTVNLLGAQDKVEPGQTAEVVLQCIKPVSVKRAKPTFVFKEGGRRVGEGAINLPANP
ncbi:hypothetical protein LJR225_005314 [Phenylobacterium sp. LjRoot225]|uniref:EF-Tu C-terminal domain-related protein n=1 Tax=Phenylobacterium sp. LjRoot225 TaxID=3342285 RepID=UPI003ECECB26